MRSRFQAAILKSAAGIKPGANDGIGGNDSSKTGIKGWEPKEDPTLSQGGQLTLCQRASSDANFSEKAHRKSVCWAFGSR